MKNVPFQQNNAPAHTLATAKLVCFNMPALLPHPPYSPNLVLCDFVLMEVIAANEAYFAEFDKSYFLVWLENVRISLD